MSCSRLDSQWKSNTAFDDDSLSFNDDFIDDRNNNNNEKNRKARSECLICCLTHRLSLHREQQYVDVRREIRHRSLLSVYFERSDDD